MSPNMLQKFESLKNSVYNKYSRNPALMMVHTGTFGWIWSSAAQLWNVATNDKFTPDEKKFLLPQEALDAAVNITLFYSITNSCKNISGKLVSSGKLLSKELRTYIDKSPIKADLQGKIGKFDTNLGNEFEKIKDGNFHKLYQPFKNGVDLAVNTVACIIASNIVTPIVRNKIAAIRQKQAIADEKQATLMSAKPVLPAQNKPAGTNNPYQSTLNPPANYSGTMKV